MTLLELRYANDYALQKPDHYFRVYDRYWAPIRDKAVKILEVGIDRGGSLQLWRDYFPNGQIYGIDCRPKCIQLQLGERITCLLGYQNDTARLADIVAACGPFDVVIDDASHVGTLSLATFTGLFPAVSPGGLYVIEDWGTGYWDKWPDGKAKAYGDFVGDGMLFPSHQYGMVGFVKQLVDVCNTSDRTHGQESSAIASMELMPGLVLLRKVDNKQYE